MVLKRLTNWGVPWHGLVRNGQLELPNGEAMPWPQWSRLDRDAWREGKCIIQRLPWAVTPARTEDQQAADAAAGMQWADYFLLTNDGHLHGNFIGNAAWIYACPQGKPWLVELTGGLTDWGLTAKLFGHTRSRGEAEAAFTLSDAGQSEPVIQGLTAVDGWDVADVASHGGRAIVMLHADLMPSGLGVITAGDQAHAVGWLEVLISGSPLTNDFAFQVQVLRNRAQTLGSYWREGAKQEIDWQEWGFTSEITTTDTRPPSGCGGTTSIRVDRTEVRPLPLGSGGTQIGIVQDAWTDHLDGIVVGMLYDDNDVPQEITLDYSYRMERDFAPPDSTITGYYYRSYRYEMVGSSCGQILTGQNEWVLTYDREPRTLMRWEYTLRHGERSVTRYMQEETGDRYHVVDGSALARNIEWTFWARWTTHEGTEYIEWEPTFVGEPQPTEPIWSPDTGRDLYDAPVGRSWPPATGGASAIRLYRLSNSIFCLGYAVNPPDARDWRGTEKITALTPGGSEDYSTPTGDVRRAVIRRGAYNPATGAAVLFTDDTVSYT